MKRSGANSALRNFLGSEAAGGVLLMLTAALAMIVANINEDLYRFYHDLLHAPIGPTLSSQLGPMSLHLWINDGLVAIFLLLVRLEITREFVDGRISTLGRRRLPVIARQDGRRVGDAGVSTCRLQWSPKHEK